MRLDSSVKRQGFTIVELLIVIVVIAILAAISIVAYNGIQERAKASAVADGIKKIDKAFQLYDLTADTSEWWVYGYNPTLQDVLDDHPGLKNYIQEPPSSNFLPDTYWDYDNDGDVRVMSDCNNRTPGVNLRLNDLMDSNVAQRVDDAIDDGNLSCGRVMYNPDYYKLIYVLSPDQEFL